MAIQEFRAGESGVTGEKQSGFGVRLARFEEYHRQVTGWLGETIVVRAEEGERSAQDVGEVSADERLGWMVAVVGGWVANYDGRDAQLEAMMAGAAEVFPGWQQSGVAMEAVAKLPSDPAPDTGYGEHMAVRFYASLVEEVANYLAGNNSQTTREEIVTALEVRNYAWPLLGKPARE